MVSVRVVGAAVRDDYRHGVTGTTIVVIPACVPCCHYRLPRARDASRKSVDVAIILRKPCHFEWQISGRRPSGSVDDGGRYSETWLLVATCPNFSHRGNSIVLSFIAK